MIPVIDYARLARAVRFYDSQCGYRYIEVPWMVSQYATRVTLPQDVYSTQALGRGHLSDLVGSAEQSFIQLMLDGTLPLGRYVALTPCWREETVYNELYRPYFMKVELIHVGGQGEGDIARVMEDAYTFFVRELPTMAEELAYVPQGGTAIDINLNGIEIGSYGDRQHEGLRWVYGTGVAEPRFSVAKRSMV